MKIWVSSTTQRSELRMNIKKHAQDCGNLWSIHTLAEGRRFFIASFLPFLSISFSLSSLPNLPPTYSPVPVFFLWQMSKCFSVSQDGLKHLGSRSSSSWKLGQQCICIPPQLCEFAFFRPQKICSTPSIFHNPAIFLFTCLFFLINSVTIPKCGLGKNDPVFYLKCA